MRIFDLFPIHDEIGLLNLRVRLLPDVIHIASEGSHTFQGQSKEPYLPNMQLQDNLAFTWVNLDQFGDDYDSNWKREQCQRDALMEQLEYEDPDDEDLILSCDVDEFVDPNAIERIINMTKDGIVRLEMRTYFYGIKWQSNMWYHPIAGRYKNLNGKSLDGLRTSKSTDYVPQAGWHITYSGSVADRIKKLESFSHSEYNTLSNKEIASYGHLSGVDPFGSRMHTADINGMHPLVVEYFDEQP